MPAAFSLSLLILCPAFLGLAGMVAPRRAAMLRVALSVAAPIFSLALLVNFIRTHGMTSGVVTVEWMPSLQLAWAFNPDKLGLFFAMLVLAVGVLIVLYVRAYFGPNQGALFRIFPTLLLFMTGMLGLVLADNFMLLLLFWELTSVSSFLLIGWEREDPLAVKNALQAFVVTGSGGIALLGGLVLLGNVTDIWSFSQLAAAGIDPSNWKVTAAFLLIFFGVMTKSAQWPMHFWLPSAMAAPTPISAYLHSATMVKAGVYLVARLADPLAALPAWPILLVSIGAITMVVGAYIALRKSDLKLIFAFTTISQLGLLVCLYGLAAYTHDGKPAVLWDITQILNHALYKAPLFILAGAIAHVAYTRDLRDLYGLFYRGRTERIIAVLMLLAVYAMASGPLTLGFTSKEFFLYSVYNAYQAAQSPLLIVMLTATVLQGAISVTIFCRFALTLLGPESGSATQLPHDPNAEEERIAYEDYHAIQGGFWAGMLWLPAAILIALQYIGGIAPAILTPLLDLFERHPGHFSGLPGLWYAVTHPGIPLLLSGVAIVLGLTLAFVPVIIHRAPVWRRSITDRHEKLFPLFYTLATKGGGKLFALMQTGNLRTYLAMLCVATVALVLWSLGVNDGSRLLHIDRLFAESWAQNLPIYALGSLVCLAAVFMLFIRHRAGRVMVLGSVGFSIAAIFYMYNAPDVALTQIAIEIVALILFLLALGLLPRTPAEGAREKWLVPPRALIAISVGAVMAWLTLASSMEQRPSMDYADADGAPIASLGEFFLNNSYKAEGVDSRHPGGGGNNVVNVILVDFRGMDTFGEITVLAIAALGVLVLLHRRPRPMHETPARRHALATIAPRHIYPPPQLARTSATTSPRQRWSRGASISTEPLRVATKLLVPLSLLFALFIFFKGHQQPGGGFVAGLVMAIAFIAHRMAHGRASLRHMLQIKEQKLIGIGLLCALISGSWSMLMGLPFLTSRFGYILLPGTGDPFEWATVLIFDLGVFLVVLGVVLAMINALSAEAEAA